jgi:hypothetical protein
MWWPHACLFEKVETHKKKLLEEILLEYIISSEKMLKAKQTKGEKMWKLHRYIETQSIFCIKLQ